jgi:hypothetical protein
VGRDRHAFAAEVQMATPVLDPRVRRSWNCNLSRTRE